MNEHRPPRRSRPTFTDQEALQFHAQGRPGKLEVVATKPMATQRDLSLAYSPGVAVPVLAIAGDRDYVTPPAWARIALAASPRGRIVVIPKLGHMPFGMEALECIDSLIIAFLERPDASKLDVSCIEAMKPPPFVLPTTTATSARD